MVDARANVLCNFQDVKEEEQKIQEQYTKGSDWVRYEHEYKLLEQEVKVANNCQLFVDHEILAGQVSFITLRYDADSKIETSFLTDQTSIENEDFVLSYQPQAIEAGAMFTLKDKLTGETNPLGFSLRFWQGSQNNGQNSGVYIFRPTSNQYDSYVYSNVDSLIGSGS